MALIWRDFINRPHISNLEMNEQLRLYNIENKRLIDQRRQREFLIKERETSEMYSVTSAVASSGAAGDIGPVDSFTNTYSMAFDGVDDYIDCGQSSAILTATFTVSCWVNVSAFGGWDTIIGCDRYSPSSGWKLWYDGANIKFSYGGVGSTEFAVSGNMVTGTWYQLIVVCDGAGNSAIFLDGVSKGTGFMTMTYSALIRFIIGARNANGGGLPATDSFNGKIDEVAIWNTDQTANIAEIYGGGSPVDLNNLTTAPAPTAWWRMGDDASWNGSDWTLTDQGSGGNNGTSDSMGEEDRVEEVPL